MFKKRTRLYTHFELKNLYHVFKSLIFKKKNFSDILKKYLKVKNIHLTSQGRVSLYDIIKIIIKKNKKKIFFISPFTIPEVIYAIKYAGGDVKYIDINLETGLIDETILEKEINNESAGIIITHLYSNSENIKKFISKFEGKIPIIEDAAINFGASVENKFLGTLTDYGFYSFHLVKNLNTLNGGAIYIKNDDEFMLYNSSLKKKKFPFKDTINLLITVFIIKIFFNNFSYQIFHYFLKYVYKFKFRYILKKIYPILYHEKKIEIPKNYFYDFNWIMNDSANLSLQKINEDYLLRLSKAKLYEKYLDTNKIKKFKYYQNENIFLEYPIILKKNNNMLMHKILFNKGYDVRHTWYINNAKELSDYKSENFKNTEILEEKILCLPLHKNISHNDIVNISNILNLYE